MSTLNYGIRDRIGVSSSATNVSYNTSATGIPSETLQEAIDRIYSSPPGGVTDKRVGVLEPTKTVQAAIDAGFRNIRITSNVTEAGLDLSSVTSEGVFIQIDAGRTWAFTSGDIISTGANLSYLRIQGEGVLAWQGGSAITCITLGADIPVLISGISINLASLTGIIPFISATSTQAIVQDCQFNLPNTPNVGLFQFADPGSIVNKVTLYGGGASCTNAFSNCSGSYASINFRGTWGSSAILDPLESSSFTDIRLPDGVSATNIKGTWTNVVTGTGVTTNRLVITSDCTLSNCVIGRIAITGTQNVGITNTIIKGAADIGFDASGSAVGASRCYFQSCTFEGLVSVGSVIPMDPSTDDIHFIGCRFLNNVTLATEARNLTFLDSTFAANISAIAENLSFNECKFLSTTDSYAFNGDDNSFTRCIFNLSTNNDIGFTASNNLTISDCGFLSTDAVDEATIEFNAVKNAVMRGCTSRSTAGNVPKSLVIAGACTDLKIVDCFLGNPDFSGGGGNISIDPAGGVCSRLVIRGCTLAGDLNIGSTTGSLTKSSIADNQIEGDVPIVITMVQVSLSNNHSEGTFTFNGSVNTCAVSGNTGDFATNGTGWVSSTLTGNMNGTGGTVNFTQGVPASVASNNIDLGLV